ncbi:MAG TPA: hypothetical protein VJX67_18610, partial [Blastocatellia bacterium]|nr:hypothetical protein [Blastocatellia bacterium]
VALATQAGTDPVEMLRVAAELPPAAGDAWTAEEALEAISRVVRSPDLREIVRLLDEMAPDELKGVLATIKRQRKKQQKQP